MDLIGKYDDNTGNIPDVTVTKALVKISIMCKEICSLFRTEKIVVTYFS